MLELQGNIWDYHARGHSIIITTNGAVDGGKRAIMGRGVALEAAQKYPDLPALLGQHLRTVGNVPAYFDEYKLFTLPTKHHWVGKSDIPLIQDSLRYLIDLAEAVGSWPLYMVRPGCGNGQLDWAEVKPKIASMLDDRFVVVERRPQ
ncbi:MAG: hypothetical protein Q8O76_10540 [Chloroflexota bacterium]|nr:hypothetical protein [Chloroflexota bacterium]